MDASRSHLAPVGPLGLRRRWLVRGSAIAVGTLLGFLAFWNAGVIPRDWFARKSHEAPHAAPPAARTPSPPPPSGTVKPITPLTPLPGTDSSISDKPLALWLSGTLPGRNVFEGYAMIGVSRENPQTYAAAALLANGARLVEIHDKYVVLERRGHKARLYLQDLTSQPVTQAAVSDILTVGGPQKIQPAVATSTEPLTDYLRPSPRYDGTVLRGYEVYPGKRSSVFSRLGLQAGDVITSIDGTPLEDSTQAFELFHQLMEGVALSATVSRKGKREQIVLDGALITADQERATHAASEPASAAQVGPPPT